MPSKKYDIILETLNRVAKDITDRPNNYMSILITAANNHKYRFEEQLLIYAQKPNATACAEVDTWNKLGRWVNRGTKGIALIVNRNTPYKLRHVFDISDTNSLYGHTVEVWQMKPHYEEAVRDALENSFGESDAKNFMSFLVETARNAVEDNYTDYADEILNFLTCEVSNITNPHFVWCRSSKLLAENIFFSFLIHFIDCLSATTHTKPTVFMHNGCYRFIGNNIASTS